MSLLVADTGGMFYIQLKKRDILRIETGRGECGRVGVKSELK